MKNGDTKGKREKGLPSLKLIQVVPSYITKLGVNNAWDRCASDNVYSKSPSYNTFSCLQN